MEVEDNLLETNIIMLCNSWWMVRNDFNILRESPHGEVVNWLDDNIIESEFELHSHNYIRNLTYTVFL